MNELHRVQNLAPRLIMVSLKCIVLAMLVLCVVYPSTTLLRIPRPSKGAALHSSNGHHQHMDVHNVNNRIPKGILSAQAKMMVELVARKVEDMEASMDDHHATHGPPLKERDNESIMGQWDRMTGKGHTVAERDLDELTDPWRGMNGKGLTLAEGHVLADRDTESIMGQWDRLNGKGHALAERDTEGSMNDWYKTHGHPLAEKSQDSEGNDVSKRHHLRPGSQVTSTQPTTTTDSEIIARGWPRPNPSGATRPPHPPAAVMARRIHRNKPSQQPAVSVRPEISARSGDQTSYVCPHNDPWCHYPDHRPISGPLVGGSKKLNPPAGVVARRVPPEKIRTHKSKKTEGQPTAVLENSARKYVGPWPTRNPHPPAEVIARENEHVERYENCAIAQAPPVSPEETGQTTPNVQPRRVPCHRPPFAPTTDNTAVEVIEPREDVPEKRQEERVVARCYRLNCPPGKDTSRICTLPGGNIEARGCGCDCQSEDSTTIHERGGEISNAPGADTSGCSCNSMSGCSCPKIEETPSGSFLNGYKCAPDEKPCPWWSEYTNPNNRHSNAGRQTHSTTVHKRVDAVPELSASSSNIVTDCPRTCHRGHCRCNALAATKRNGDLDATETQDNNSTGIAPIMAYLESHEGEINKGNISEVDVGSNNNNGTNQIRDPGELTLEQKQAAQHVLFAVIAIVGGCVMSLLLLYLWHLYRRRLMQKSSSQHKPEISQKSFGGMRRIDEDPYEDPYEDLGAMPMTLDGANDGWTRWILQKRSISKPNQLSPTPKNRPPRIPTLRLPQPIFSTVRKANGIDTETSMGYDKFDIKRKDRYGSRVKWTSTV